MRAADLSRELREGSGSFLPRRRGVAGLALAAMGGMGVIALYQVGIIRHLPDPPLPGFDADAVHSSPVAYALFAMPDAVLGLASYAATLALAAAGGRDRARTHPWLPLALAAKVAFDIAQAGRLTIDEVTEQRALSAWSLLATGATMATGPLVIPEARAAVRCLLAGM